jgi:hypothetical protein
MVGRGLEVVPPARERGYEVLGYGYGSFNSFAVNHLENEFIHRLGLRLNGNGLFDDYASALKAARYCAEPATGAEPGLWLPWKESEYSL